MLSAGSKVLAPSYALHKSFPDVKPETLTANLSGVFEKLQHDNVDKNRVLSDLEADAICLQDRGDLNMLPWGSGYKLLQTGRLEVSVDVLAVLAAHVPRIPWEAWMFQWKVGRNESNDPKRRKAYGQSLGRKGQKRQGDCKMVTYDLAVDLSPERFYTRCVKCNGQGLEHFDRNKIVQGRLGPLRVDNLVKLVEKTMRHEGIRSLDTAGTKQAVDQVIPDSSSSQPVASPDGELPVSAAFFLCG
eukprot:s462_g4.t1